MSDIFEQVDISPVTRILISLVVLKNEEQKYRFFFPGLILYEGLSLVSRTKLVLLRQRDHYILWKI